MTAEEFKIQLRTHCSEFKWRFIAPCPFCKEGQMYAAGYEDGEPTVIHQYEVCNEYKDKDVISYLHAAKCNLTGAN